MSVNELSGGTRQSKRSRKKTSTEKSPSDNDLSQATEETNAINSHVIVRSVPSTPKRGRRRTQQTQEACLTSTPVHRSSTGHLGNISELSPGSNQVELECTELIDQFKVLIKFFTDK